MPFYVWVGGYGGGDVAPGRGGGAGVEVEGEEDEERGCGEDEEEEGKENEQGFHGDGGFLCPWSGGSRRLLRSLRELVRVERVYISFVVTIFLM